MLLNTAAFSFPESTFFLLSKLVCFKLHGKLVRHHVFPHVTKILSQIAELQCFYMCDGVEDS